jgi:ATP-binding cassette, subfamily C, bacterial PrsD
MIRFSSARTSEIGELFRRFPLPLSALIGLSVVANLLTLTGSIFMLQVYDRVLTSRSIPTLVALTLLMATMYGFFIAIESLRLRIAARLAGVWSDALSPRLFAAYVRQGLRQGDGTDALRDLDTVQTYIGGAGLFVLLDLPWVPLYLALVFALHPLLGWLALAGGAVITLLLIVSEVQSRGSSRLHNNLYLQRTGIAENARANAEAVVAMGMLKQISSRWQIAADQLNASQRRTSDRLAIYTSASRGFRYFLQSAVLALGAYLAIEGEMTAGLMIAASIITARALAPIEQAIAHWRGFVGARQAFHRLEEAVAASSEPSISIQLPRPSRQLVAVNVATAPEKDRAPLAAGINFALSAGEGLGVVGLSGSGKSSLARALVGIWPLLSGQVRFDGSELSHFDREQLGAATGYLPQTVELFEGSVAENIARFQPGDVTDAVLRAAEQAQLHDLIAALPRGYETQIGRQGSILSAGQRQRIGLARALYGDPFLIVLDEPNSNLDGEGDQALTKAIENAKARGAIVVVVAHRPSAIAALDKLLLMEKGRQVRFGEKSEVLQAIGVNSARATAERIEQKGGRSHVDAVAGQ